MEMGFPTESELLSLAAFYLEGHGTDVLLEDGSDLDAPEDVRGWLSLDQMREDYGVAPDTVIAGLEAHAKRGAIRMARDGMSSGAVYVELRRDVRQAEGYRPWSIRQGVRLLLEIKDAHSTAPLRLV